MRTRHGSRGKEEARRRMGWEQKPEEKEQVEEGERERSRGGVTS